MARICNVPMCSKPTDNASSVMSTPTCPLPRCHVPNAMLGIEVPAEDMSSTPIATKYESPFVPSFSWIWVQGMAWYVEDAWNTNTDDDRCTKSPSTWRYDGRVLFALIRKKRSYKYSLQRLVQWPSTSELRTTPPASCLAYAFLFVHLIVLCSTLYLRRSTYM